VKISKDRLRYKLREQIRFIERSCKTFDQGEEDEAIRLATTLRILFHDTSKSTSLLKLLSLKNNGILSSNRGHGDWQDYLKIELDFESSEPVKMRPILGTKFHKTSIANWWQKESVLFTQGTSIGDA